MISKKTTRKQLAAIVTKHLNKNGVECILVGGSVVSLYTNNKYESKDLDFISDEEHQVIVKLMAEIGFEPKGKDFHHPACEFTVEFPRGPLSIGDDEDIEAEGLLEEKGVQIKLLSPTQSVMDRLMWFYTDNDRQCLDQAVWISQEHPVNFEKIKMWSVREGEEEKYRVFLNHLKKNPD